MMIKLCLGFQFFYAIGVLKYYLYFLQIEHSILIMDFVHDIILASSKLPDSYPITHQLQSQLLVTKSKYSPFIAWKSNEAAFIFDHIDAFHSEVSAFTKHKYGLTLSASEERTLFRAQKAVMRSTGKALPLSVYLEHDLVAYIKQIKDITVINNEKRNFKPLGSMPPSTLDVSTRKNLDINSLDFINYDRHGFSGWELKSALRF